MTVIEKVVAVTYELTPEEYERRAYLIEYNVIGGYREDGYECMTNPVNYTFDANYNKYYVTLKFEK